MALLQSITEGTTMEYYAGIDVSLESSSICVVDLNGRVAREATIASDPEALTAWFKGLGFDLTRIGLEAGPLSQWLYAGMREAGLSVELLETRHVRNAFKIMPVKTDRKDARGIAQLIRLGWFRPVHCKSLGAQATRSLLGARKLLQSKLHDIELSVRGTLRGFGLKIGKTTPKSFESRVRELVANHPTLLTLAAALLKARAVLAEQFIQLDKQLHAIARCDIRARLLTTVPGVGSIVALTFAAAIDDPGRFKSSKTVGALFGLTPKRYQSGETDMTGRRRGRAYGALRGGQCHFDAHAERLVTQKVGYGGGEAVRNAQGQGGAGAKARSGDAPDASGRPAVRRAEGCRGSITRGEITNSGSETDCSEQGPVAGMMDQVRPQTTERRRKAHRAPIRLAGRS
jgi:transposase